MSKSKVKYNKVDCLVHGEVKEIKLIGEDEKDKNYFVFWINHNNEHRSTRVRHKQLFDWFRIDQIEFDKKFVREQD